MNPTRDQILDLLKAADGHFVSSREICSVLNTSRTAVWKHIHALVQQGYEVEAVTNKGYRLAGNADLVTTRELEAYIATRVLGRRVIYQATVDSTNRAAGRLADEGVPEGTLVLADEQTEGHGRWNREWVSPPRTGILMSLILRPPLPVTDSSMLTSLAAVAVAKALEKIVRVQVAIKWPNDIMIDRKKTGGILIDVSAEGNWLRYAVVGVGINANSLASMFPDVLQPHISSLREVLGRPVRRAEVAAAILAEFEARYEASVGHGDFSAVLKELRDLSDTIGRHVEVDAGHGKLTGVAEGIADDGALILRLAGGQVKKLFSGDIVSARVR